MGKLIENEKENSFDSNEKTKLNFCQLKKFINNYNFFLVNKFYFIKNFLYKNFILYKNFVIKILFCTKILL